MTALGAAGLTRVLAKGGGQLAAALLRADLVDRIAWFHAPSVMGGDGWPAVQAFGVETLDHMPRFRRDCITAIGDDMLSEYTRQRAMFTGIITALGQVRSIDPIARVTTCALLSTRP